MIKPNTTYLVEYCTANKCEYTVIHNLVDTWIHATAPESECTVDWNIDPTNIVIKKVTLVAYPLTLWSDNKNFIELPFNLFETNPEFFI